ncbi:MAG: radical SAM peptide maturase [Bacteroidetes bacterium]|nr:radical SAM peptide maturase [Bacteroidota bacterium]
MPNIQIKKELIEKYFKRVNHLVIETSEICNLSCLYCGQGKNYVKTDSHKKKKHMDWHTVKPLLDYYISLWHSGTIGLKRFFMLSFYGGEPLLNFELIDNVHQYIERNKPADFLVYYSITTNGMLLDRYIEYFVHHNYTIAVSLDGDKISNSFRVDKSGTESFDTLYHILINIKERYPDFFDRKVSFQSVLNSRSNLIDVYAFFKEMFNKEPLLLEMSKSRLSLKSDIYAMYRGIDEDLEISWKTRKEECVKFSLKNLDTSYLDFYIKTYTPHFILRYPDFFQEFDNVTIKLPTATCLPFSDRVFLTVGGLILPCEKVGCVSPLGYVINGEIDIDFQKIVDFYNEIFNKYQKLCETCIRTMSCTNCFYDINYLAKKNICPDYVPNSQKDKYIQRALEILRRTPEIFKKIINSID